MTANMSHDGDCGSLPLKRIEALNIRMQRLEDQLRDKNDEILRLNTELLETKGRLREFNRNIASNENVKDLVAEVNRMNEEKLDYFRNELVSKSTLLEQQYTLNAELRSAIESIQHKKPLCESKGVNTAISGTVSSHSETEKFKIAMKEKLKQIEQLQTLVKEMSDEIERYISHQKETKVNMAQCKAALDVLDVNVHDLNQVLNDNPGPVLLRLQALNVVRPQRAVEPYKSQSENLDSPVNDGRRVVERKVIKNKN